MVVMVDQVMSGRWCGSDDQVTTDMHFCAHLNILLVTSCKWYWSYTGTGATLEYSLLTYMVSFRRNWERSVYGLGTRC